MNNHRAAALTWRRNERWGQILERLERHRFHHPLYVKWALNDLAEYLS